MSLTTSIFQELLKLDFAFPVLSALQVETVFKLERQVSRLYRLNALIINACVSESMYLSWLSGDWWYWTGSGKKRS